LASYPISDVNYHLDEVVHRTFLLRDFVHALRRHRLLVGIVTLIGTIAGSAVVLFMEPQFTASASVVLDPRRPHVTDLPSVFSEQPTQDPEALQLKSEAKILQSEDLARRVVLGLGLMAMPEFQNHPMALPPFIQHITQSLAEKTEHIATRLGLPSRIVDRIRGASDASVTAVQRDRMAAAIDLYLRRLSVVNDGRSYIITVKFNSLDPELAAKIVNTHIELYLSDQIAFNRTATRQATEYLREQVATLAVKQRASEEAVQKFREDNKIVVVGGTTLRSQQLTVLNAEMPSLRADLDHREAMLRQAKQLREHGQLDSNSDILNSPTIQNLRSQEAVLMRNVAELRVNFGENYPAVKRAQSELNDLRTAIKEEANRIIANLENEVLVARSRIAELTSQLAGMTQETVVADRAQAKLQELDREAEADRTLLKTLIGRLKELEAQEGMQQANGREMSPALPPSTPTTPRLLFLLPLIMLGSSCAGAGVAFMRELTNRGFRGSSEIELECELPSLGSVPVARAGWTASSRPHDVILDRPRSSFAESIRYIRNAIQEGPQSAESSSTAILVTSSLPNEGKTVFAISLARSFAQAGKRVLLIDCDMRKKSLCDMLGPGDGRLDDHPDLGDVLNGAALYTEAIRSDRAGLDFLPSRPSLFAPQDLLSRRTMAKIMEQCRRSYDVILLDSPPVAAVSDALILSRYVDQTLFLVRWDRTPREIAKLTTRKLLAYGTRLAGVVLTNVDLHRGSFSPMEIEYYHKLNRKYYHE
jgi:capsular exopolysaccharide synthesis family protein